MINDKEVQLITGSWDYATLPPNVRIGKDCYLERRDSFKRFRSKRNPGLLLGDRVSVYTWTEFNSESASLIEVGDDSILVGAIFMCAEHISIGKRVIISYNTTIADSDFHPIDPKQRQRDAIANSPFGDQSARPKIVSDPVIIGDDVWVGIGSIILKGVRIGSGARIGAGAVVTRDVPENAYVSGNPGRVSSGSPLGQ